MANLFTDTSNSNLCDDRILLDKAYVDNKPSYHSKFSRSLKVPLTKRYAIRSVDKSHTVLINGFDPEDHDHNCFALEDLVQNRHNDTMYELIELPLVTQIKTVADFKIGTLESATLEYATDYFHEFMRTEDSEKKYKYRAYMNFHCDDLRVIAEKYEGHTGHRSWK